jgi:site-specific DNA-methyltransferase (adenine-specific)
MNYEEYLEKLATVCAEVYRVLVPGGRLICLISDMWLSRKKFGRHRVVPFHADLSTLCRKLGFDNLTPIIWQKSKDENELGNKGSKFLGAPYEPNGVIHSDIEFIIMQRKPGGYRKPTPKQRALSKINKFDYKIWFRQFWKIYDDSGQRQTSPFPYEIADRLVRMFSFWGDTVLDPFCRRGTTLVAAMKCQRSSIGIDIDERRCRIALNRLQEENEPLFTQTRFEFLRSSDLKGPD